MDMQQMLQQSRAKLRVQGANLNNVHSRQAAFDLMAGLQLQLLEGGHSQMFTALLPRGHRRVIEQESRQKSDPTWHRSASAKIDSSSTIAMDELSMHLPPNVFDANSDTTDGRRLLQRGNSSADRRSSKNLDDIPAYGDRTA